MFRPITRSHRRPNRRGTSFILIVVIMTSIMAAVGVAYALFAMQIARNSALHKEAQGGGTSAPVKAPDPTDTINRFFGALIYDVGDDYDPNDANNSLNNGLRGHSLSASMYGRIPGNTTPWNGVGPFHEDPTQPGPYAGYGLSADRARFVNYTLGASPSGQLLLLDPEWTGPRMPAGAPLPSGANQTGRAYIGKHVGYSYPDLNNFFLAQIDPATGEVLVPSFHRQSAFGTLDPNNPNWYASSPQGRLLTLRPRPAEHPQFPRVPRNADDSYTGDVQNLPGGSFFNGQYVSRNDSLWMNLGLPVVPMGKKKVQPLVAPLIIPLNALFNASVHGNTLGNNNAHQSYAGYGPWEVNIVPGLLNAADGQAIVNGRGPRQQRNGNAARAYDAYGSGAPNSAAVAWTPGVGYPAYPTAANDLSGLPGFGPTFQSGAATSGFNNTTTVANHPALFNPTEWAYVGTAGFPRTYPLGDIKRLNSRYAFVPDWYGQSILGPTAQSSLGNNGSVYPFIAATGQSTPHSYRLDPAHANRALVTSRSYELDRPKLVPNFMNRDGAAGLQYVNGKIGTVSPGLYPSSPPAALGAATDFAGTNQWVNALAALGSVNLNRPLADYRDLGDMQNVPNPQPLSATNIGNLANADSDRQQFARDIFVRLIAALGASAKVNPDGSYVIPGGLAQTDSQYKALRYLAQIAVNIVDYIDNDDIITAFAWHPNGDTVYGVEKTRLVINEAYSEIVNDPTDMAGTANTLPTTGKAHVRFWLELLNPSSVPAAGSPLNDGSVSLPGYRIEIRRANRQTGVPGGVAPANKRDATPTTQNDYLYGNPSDNANVTGSFEATAGLPDAVYTFPATVTPATVGPNGGQYAQANLPANGIVLVGPPVTANAPDEFNPTPGGGVWTNLIQSDPVADAPNSPGLGYKTDLPASGAAAASTEYKRHIVLLRRVLNPYLPVAGQTYITVDMMDFVPSFDAIAKLTGDQNSRAAGGAGYDPVTDRFSIGKVQPYAGRAFVSTINGNAHMYNQYSFPTSTVLAQTAANNAQPKHTFGRHNGTHAGTAMDPLPAGSSFVPTNNPAAPPTLTDTIMTPFDWMVHMDRPLVNQIELFQVQDGPPHLVTNRFLVPYYQDPIPAPPANPLYQTPGVYYEAGYGNWRALHDGLGRALELLTVKPFTAGVAHGGRVAGRINLNGVQDQRILQGVMDPQGGNGFDMNFVNNTAWGTLPPAAGVPGTGWMYSRTALEQRVQADGSTRVRTQAASGTIYDGTGGDRPFMTFGAPAIDGGSSFAYSGRGDIDQTILRRLAPNQPSEATPSPALYTPAPAAVNPAQPNGHPYYQAEAVRKMLNNVTTVNQQYLVIMTIGYFEVLPNGTLGPEAFINIPGDTRQQVMGVVDMSNMALDPNPAIPLNSPAPAPGQPFFTSLEQTARPVAGAGTLYITCAGLDSSSNVVVYADGQPVSITPNSTLVLGYGAEQQVVTVANGPSTTTTLNGQTVGVISVTGMTRTAWGGSCVSNVKPGYPGPQPNFKYDAPAFTPVLPYIERVR